jgi:hypothetical protein
MRNSIFPKRLGNSFIRQIVIALCLFVTSAMLTQCAKRAESELNLPGDILGISVGMSAGDAQKHLKEIAKLVRIEKKRQEVWELRNDARFGYLAVGYDKENRVRYVTAIAKPRDAVLVNYSEIADLSAAKQEIVEPNRRYTWQAEARDGRPAYAVIVQGTAPNSLSMYTHTIVSKEPELEDEEEERKESEESHKK